MNLYKQIYDTNINLLKRVDNDKIKIKYLSEDVLLVSLGVPLRYSDSIEIGDGLLVIHYNPNNYKITGFTVPYVKEFIKTSLAMKTAVDLAKQKREKLIEEEKIKPQTVASAGMYGLSCAI